MKAKFLTAALAALFLGTAAYAHDCDKKEKEKPPSSTQSSSLMTAPEPTFAPSAPASTKPDAAAQASSNPSSGGNTLVGQGEVAGENAAPGEVSASADRNTAIAPEASVGVGGSGSVDVQGDTSSKSQSLESSGSSSVQSDTGLGGSGTMNNDSAVCPPGSEAMGGSGESSWNTGSSSSSQTTEQQSSATGGSEAFDTAAARREQEAREKEEKGKNDMRGLTVMAGGGVEGYTFDLAPEIDPGVTWGVTAALKPSSVLGLEFGYSGAANEFSGETGSSGADLVRNGGQAVVTLGLAATAVQPYILGGIGINNYNVRGDESGRFTDDTTGAVPVGLGLRTHLGSFTADARFGYNFLFDQEFARGVSSTGPDDNFADTGNYRGTINLGTTF